MVCSPAGCAALPFLALLFHVVPNVNHRAPSRSSRRPLPLSPSSCQWRPGSSTGRKFDRRALSVERREDRAPSSAAGGGRRRIEFVEVFPGGLGHRVGSPEAVGGPVVAVLKLGDVGREAIVVTAAVLHSTEAVETAVNVSRVGIIAPPTGPGKAERRESGIECQEPGKTPIPRSPFCAALSPRPVDGGLPPIRDAIREAWSEIPPQLP